MRDLQDTSPNEDGAIVPEGHLDCAAEIVSLRDRVKDLLAIERHWIHKHRALHERVGLRTDGEYEPWALVERLDALITAKARLEKVEGAAEEVVDSLTQAANGLNVAGGDAEWLEDFAAPLRAALSDTEPAPTEEEPDSEAPAPHVLDPRLQTEARLLAEVIARVGQLSGMEAHVRPRLDVGRMIVHLGGRTGHLKGRRLFVTIQEQVDRQGDGE